MEKKDAKRGRRMLEVLLSRMTNVEDGKGVGSSGVIFEVGEEVGADVDSSNVMLEVGEEVGAVVGFSCVMLGSLGSMTTVILAISSTSTHGSFGRSSMNREYSVESQGEMKAAW